MHPADTFRSTAPYYARYRARYPRAFFDYLGTRFHLDAWAGAGQGGLQRLLDLGCGPGDLAVPLSKHVAEVLAMDPEPEMLDEARAAAEQAGVKNVRFLTGGSNDLERLKDDLGLFWLVTMGESFHWMDRDTTLETLYEMVRPGGGIAVTWKQCWPASGGPDWSEAAMEVVRQHLGERRRAGSGFRQPETERHEAVIARSPFRRTELLPEDRFSYRQLRTVDDIVGLEYSMSSSSPYVLGEKREAFEEDLRRALLALSPSGEFEEDVHVGAILAWKGPA